MSDLVASGAPYALTVKTVCARGRFSTTHSSVGLDIVPLAPVA